MSNESPKEFRNENVTVAVSEQPNCRVTFEMNISPQASEAAYRKAIKNVTREVSLPGFRKGRAPEKLILQHYAKHIDDEWRLVLTNTAFGEAISLTNIHPHSRESFDRPKIKKYSREEGSQVSISFERQPAMPKIDPKNIRLRRVEPQAVTPDRIEQAIEELRTYHAKWEPVEPRAVREGDYVLVDIDTLGEKEERICTNERFHVLEGSMDNWLRKLLIGAHVGESVEGSVESREGQNAPLAQCRVRINGIVEQVLPPVDEELSKKAGCKDVAELRTNVGKSLEQRAQRQAKQALYQQLEEQLMDLYPIDLPVSWLRAVAHNRLECYREALQGRLSPDEIHSREPQFRDEARQLAERQMKLLYLLEGVAREDETITKDELLQELHYQRYLAQPVEREIHSEMKPEEVRQQLVNIIIARRMKERLLELVSYE